MRAAPRLRPSRKRESVSATRHGRRKRAGISSAAKWRDASSRCARRSPTASAVAPTRACEQVFKELKNPYYLGDEVGLTQSLGWVEAWTSEPSVYAVAAKTTQDVVAAVNFARTNNLRLVVKGGGHSYQGTSNAADSLLIWTRHMNAVTLHDAFVGAGCAGNAEPQPAVSIEPGAIWGHVYDEVTTKGGRYVQGGGCMTVGVAGLVQGGGFGSCSKAFGLAGSEPARGGSRDRRRRGQNRQCLHESRSVLGAEGRRRRQFGVVTRVTLRTHELPEFFGGVFATIKASSDEAYRRLIAKILEFYAQALFNPHWGEQIGFAPAACCRLRWCSRASTSNRRRRRGVRSSTGSRRRRRISAFVSAPRIISEPARHFWDPASLKTAPGVVIADDRPGAPADNVFWASNLEEAGRVWHAYQSAWLPQSLLADNQRERLADALFAAAQHWGVSLHFNKGLAGATADAIATARDTAMNPAVVDAFALAIIGAGGPPAYPGIPGHEPDAAAARREAARQ